MYTCYNPGAFSVPLNCLQYTKNVMNAFENENTYIHYIDDQCRLMSEQDEKILLKQQQQQRNNRI